MKSASIAAMLVVALLSVGCAQLGGTRFKRSYLSIKDVNDQTIGTILVWEADTSAAILFKDGGACMQTALAVKTTEFEAKAKISDALLSLSKTAATVASNPGATANQPLADITSSIKEAAQLLTTTTERTAFLNIGMFYLCQIAANKSLTPGEADALADTLIKAAAGMK
jgi:hypothetical protein